jgi:hypothetical protein
MLQLEKNKQTWRICAQDRQVVAQRLIISVKNPYWLTNGFLEPIKSLSVPMMPVGYKVDQFNPFRLQKWNNHFADGALDTKKFLRCHLLISRGTRADTRGCVGRFHSPKTDRLSNVGMFLICMFATILRK